MLKKVLRTLRALTLQSVPKCEVLQFGGTELSGLKALTEDFVVANMPLISERLNVRVLTKCFFTSGPSRWAYYNEYINLAGASVLVVWHDTNIEAFQIRKFIKVPVYCVQNGLRHDVGPVRGAGFLSNIKTNSRTEQLGVSKYFVFGSSERQLLSELSDTEFVPHGSFRANVYGAVKSEPASSMTIKRVGYIASLPARSSVVQGRIFRNTDSCLRLRDHIFSYHDFFAFDAVVVRAVLNACGAMGKEFGIIAKKPPSESTDREFFQDSLGEQVHVLEHSKGDGYSLADQFDCLVTIDSTLGYEMMALGKPVAFISNRLRFLGLKERDLTFGFPLSIDESGPFWSSATAVVDIEMFLHKWFSRIESPNYEHDPNPFGLMNLDPNNSLLRMAIQESLAKAT
ncbi:MAG: hypothetical protein EBU12_10060 [Microbacteriaceae bacterium]|nr:hypothetical protein [Microbacteriaceae bacterium]